MGVEVSRTKQLINRLIILAYVYIWTNAVSYFNFFKILIYHVFVTANHVKGPFIIDPSPEIEIP